MRLLPVVPMLLLAPLLAGADHQAGVSFDHKTGNEWWVEVLVAGPDGAVTRVEAMDTGGSWVALDKKSWGAYGASFHIEPGHDVRFRAHTPDGIVASCWFTHPAGQERCGPDRQVRTVGEVAASTAGNLALGDPWDDGTGALFVATGAGIEVHAWDGTWQRTDTIAPGRAFHHVAVGDADNDGVDEVYATSDFNDLYRFVWADGWQGSSSDVPAAGSASISAIAIGDPDDDGENEVYLGTITDDAPLIQVRVNGSFEELVIATVPGGTVHLAIGDADDDGDDELVSGSENRGNDEVRVIDASPGGWTNDIIDRDHGTDGTAGVAIGDANGDGHSEVYAARPSPQGVWMSAFDGGWTTTRIATFDLWPQDLVLGDVDGDGLDELYVLTNANALTDEQDVFAVHQVSWTGDDWQAQEIARHGGGRAQALASGDADGSLALYTVGFPDACCDTNASVFRIADHAPVAPSFDPRNGNEWWVQVTVSGAVPERVQAMDTDGPWKELSLRDWGDWAGSFRVEAGHDVRFRALVDGAWHTSCWFTHPGGERTADCPGGEPPSDFDASFDTPGGNAWWVEVYVDGTGPITAVEARDDGGPWVALEKKGWGSWAKSFRVEDGSIVEFRAHTDGAMDISPGFVWPSGDPA